MRAPIVYVFGLCLCVHAHGRPYIRIHFLGRGPAKCLELPRLFRVGVHCDSLPFYSSTVPTQRSAGSSKTNLCLRLLFPLCNRPVLFVPQHQSSISRPSTSLRPLVSSIQRGHWLARRIFEICLVEWLLNFENRWFRNNFCPLASLLFRFTRQMKTHRMTFARNPDTFFGLCYVRSPRRIFLLRFFPCWLVKIYCRQ